MSTKRPVKKVIDPRQGSITALFGAAAAKAATVVEKPAAAAAAPESTILTSTDPIIVEFYSSLTPYERIAHELAIEKLGTSYDVTRTRGFQKWYSARTK